MDNMNIRELEVFRVVCEEGSITKASEKLYISQPAVSTTIKELEDEVGFELLDRLPRGVRLNERGTLFLAKVNLLLEQYEDLVNSVETIDVQAPIKIGSSITISMDYLPQIIQEFKLKYPQTPLSVTVRNAEDIEKLIEQNELDFGLVEGVIRNHDLKALPLSMYDVIVLCSPEHELAKQKDIGIEDFIKSDFLLREKGSAIRDVFESTLLLNEVSVDPIWTSINSQSIIEATLNNLGVAILPRVLVEKELENKTLVELKVNNFEMTNQNYIVYNHKRSQSESVKHFIELLKETAI